MHSAQFAIANRIIEYHMNIIYAFEDFDLVIESNVRSFLLKYAKENGFDIEHGGILAGTMNPIRHQFTVTDVTTPFEKDKQARYAFKRFEQGHQDAMDRIWELSRHRKTYLGEWHTHNEDIPTPSYIDVLNWKEINNRGHNSEQLFFAILGRKMIKVWTIKNGKVIELKECTSA